jgi:hypothetical protein
VSAEGSPPPRGISGPVSILGLFLLVAVASGLYAILPYGDGTPATLRDVALNICSELLGILAAVVVLEAAIRWHQNQQTERALRPVLSQTQELARLLSEDTERQGSELGIDDQMKLTRQVAWTHNLLAASNQLQIPAWERQTLSELLSLQRLAFEYEQLTEQLKSSLADETHPLVIKRYMTERLQISAKLTASVDAVTRTLSGREH